jgi:ABC-2 type transport system permease protein
VAEKQTVREPVVAADGAWRSAFAAFAALLARDLRVLMRFPFSFLLRTLINPFMFVFVFTYVYPQIGAGGFGGAAGHSLATVALPGLVASAIFFQGLNGVALPLSMEFGASREIEDRIMAPVPFAVSALSKVVFSMAQSVLAAGFVFLMAYVIPSTPVDIHVASWPVLIVGVTLGSALAGFLGLLLGTVVEVRQVAVVFAVTIVPLTFLGCVYYPWASLESVRWLQILVLANPLVYVSEALRAALTPDVSHMSTLASLLALTSATILLGLAATKTFVRRVLS